MPARVSPPSLLAPPSSDGARGHGAHLGPRPLRGRYPARGLDLLLAAAQHPQAQDGAAERRGQAEADLDAEDALTGPVDIAQVEQQGRLVEGQPDPRTEGDG